MKQSNPEKAELLYDAEISRKREENLQKIREFLLPFEIVAFSDRDTTEYSKIRAALDSHGLPIGPNDLLIAATAPAAISSISGKLPEGFPSSVAEPILVGFRAARRLLE